jgi:hypothetical protein
MKYLNKFNESKVGDFIRKKFNSDEEIAMGIYKKLPELLSAHITKLEVGDYDFERRYSFYIDDFSIIVANDFSGFSKNYYLWVDGVVLKCSETISKKIFKKVSEIYNRTKVEDAKRKAEDDEVIRKDARIHFAR